MFDFFKRKGEFECKGEKCIEFVGNTVFSRNAISKIWFRQPNGEEVLSYAYANLLDEEDELKKLKGEKDISIKEQHLMMIKNKSIPFARKIITRWEGYSENGKPATLDYIEDFFPDHLTIVCEKAYARDNHYKKKD